MFTPKDIATHLDNSDSQRSAAIKKQIMIIDDEPLILALFEISLRRQGPYDIVTVDNPAKALVLLNSRTPDLFILDVMMPGTDGYELCRQIRARPQTARTPILMISAWHDSQVVAKALQAGANECLSKLMPHHLLVTKVGALVSAEPTAH
jgi:two-component system, sensor histidine kinase and response regulator